MSLNTDQFRPLGLYEFSNEASSPFQRMPNNSTQTSSRRCRSVPAILDRQIESLDSENVDPNRQFTRGTMTMNSMSTHDDLKSKQLPVEASRSRPNLNKSDIVTDRISSRALSKLAIEKTDLITLNLPVHAELNRTSLKKKEDDDKSKREAEEFEIERIRRLLEDAIQKDRALVQKTPEPVPTKPGLFKRMFKRVAGACLPSRQIPELIPLEQEVTDDKPLSRLEKRRRELDSLLEILYKYYPEERPETRMAKILSTVPAEKHHEVLVKLRAMYTSMENRAILSFRKY